MDPTAQWFRMTETRNVLVALDASEESAYAFQYALQNLVRPATDHVTLVTVHDPSPYMFQPLDTEYGLDLMAPSAMMIGLERQAEEEAKDLIKKFAHLASQKQVKCVGEFHKGNVKEVLVSACQKDKADVLVVGSRGLGAIKRALLGSVSDYVLHNAPCPVLIVKKPPPVPAKDLPTEGRPRTVVVAVDQSEGAKYAFRWAIHEYCRPGLDRLILLYVQQVPSYLLQISPEHINAAELEEMEKKDFEHHELFLNSLLLQASVLKIECDKDIVKGEPRDVIIKELQHVAADILIIGSRGLGIIKRMLVGSVSEYCAHVAECPVLVVKPPQEEDTKGSAEETLPPHLTSEAG